MFRGSSTHKMDQKGRLSIPARFKKEIGLKDDKVLFITAMDHCIKAYSKSKWIEIETELNAQKKRNKNMRRFFRLFVGKAAECKIDKHGRIIIPQNLREYAAIEKEVELIGVLDHFEIWSPKLLALENEELEKDLNLEEFQNEIAELGL